MKMKAQLFVLFFLAATVSAIASPPPTVAVHDPAVDIEEGIVFESGTKQRFTGTLTSRYYHADRATKTPKGEIRYTVISDYQNGLKNGIEIQLSGDGNLMAKIGYSLGERDGLQTVYRSAFGAARHFVTYSKGRKNGLSRGYNSKGELIWEVDFEQGIARPYHTEGYITYHDTIHKEGRTFLRDAPNEPFTGIVAFFLPNGTFEYRRPYLNGLPHGLRTTYFSNGQIAEILNYRHGKLHGIGLRWHHPGSGPNEIAERAVYVDGRRIRSFKFDRSGSLWEAEAIDEFERDDPQSKGDPAPPSEASGDEEENHNPNG